MSNSILLAGASAIVLLAAATAFAAWPARSESTPASPPPATAEGAPGTAPSADTERKQVGNLVTENIPAIPPELNDRLLAYQNARSAIFDGWTPTGGMLISTRFADTVQIHRVDTPMGMRRELTFYAEPIAGGSYPRTNAAGFVFGKDSGGDENFQIYLHNDLTGADTQLTEPGGRNTGAVWSHDGKQIAWTVSSQKNATYQIFVEDAADPIGRRKVLEKEGDWEPLDWSPDGKTLLVTNAVSATESYLYLLDVASGALTQINKQPDKIAYAGGTFAPDGSSVYVTSDEGREFQTLTRLSLADGSKTLLSDDIAWDVEEFDLSRDGSEIAFSVNENGASRIYIRKTADKADIQAPSVPQGQLSHLAFSPDGAQLGFSIDSARSAGDAWSFAFADGKLTRWTDSELGGLNPDSFVEPTLFSYQTFDNRPIPAYIYKPKGAGPFPVVINIHGGPEGQSRPGFAAVWQYWVNELGIAVVVPNVRGSSGYGKSYLDLDNGLKRKDSVADIGALLDWIATQPDLKKDQVMVYGGSYGGYMVNASMVDYSPRLAGAVSIVAISNFITFLEHTSGYRADLRRVEYGDERDPQMRKFFEEIAPINHTDKITKPMLIVHGANDPRVPESEAEALYAALKKNGLKPWFMLALDEGHGFRKKSNRDAMNAAVALFFQTHLVAQGTGN